jgi:hypothetical protein
MTEKKEMTYTTKEIVLMAFLSILSMTIITAAAIPSLREKVKDAIFQDHREILAKVSGIVSADGLQVTVLKIKNKNNLSLEVFDSTNMTLIEKISLEEMHDGYVTIKGNATNLALSDIDKDGVMEIVTASFNEQMIPRLNIFKFNPGSKSFDKINSPVDGSN